MRRLTCQLAKWQLNTLSAKSGWSPLALAVYHGHRKCAEILLEVHATPLVCLSSRLAPSSSAFSRLFTSARGCFVKPKLGDEAHLRRGAHVRAIAAVAKWDIFEVVE